MKEPTVIELTKLIDSKFISLNEVPCTSIRLTKEEWLILRNVIASTSRTIK